MKHKIKKFIKLRKQSDTVKIICILVIAGICFLISLLYHVSAIFFYVNSPAEYVLSSEKNVSGKSIDELLQIENGMMVSRQKSIPITIEYNGIKTTVDCLVLSKEYAEKIFGVNVINGTKRFYMDEEALSEWKQELEDNSETVVDFNMENGVQRKDGVEFDIKYMSSDEDEGEMSVSEGDMSVSEDDMSASEGDMSASEGDMGMKSIPQRYNKGKISLIKKGTGSGKIVFTIGEPKDLIKDSYGLRVSFKRHDLDGLHVEKLRKLGYSFENENIIITDENELELKLVHIKYGIICFLICIISVGSMIRQILLTKK